MEKMNNSQDLRAFLVEQMGKVATGEQDSPAAKAICNYAQQIYNTLNIEMKMAKLKSEVPEAIIEPVSFS